MPSVEWVWLEQTTQQVCGTASIFTNGLLICLIIFKSPPKIGSYKWLMLYTAFFEFFYAFINLFAGPSVHTYGSAFIVFQSMESFSFSHKTAEFLIYTYCSCFGFSMAIFGGHFVYRYGAVDIVFRQKYLSGAKQLLLYVFPFFYGILWGVVCWLCYGETPERTEYLNSTMREDYRLDIEDCAYISAHFWPQDEYGQSHFHFMSFLGIALMWIIIMTSFISVLLFGIRCYRSISKQLEGVDVLSDTTKSLQKQLFYALIVQSSIPIVLMYIPAGMVFGFPMMDVEMNLKYPFIGLTIAIYPAIDPLPTILIIKSYRRGCLEMLKWITCRKNNKVAHEEAVSTTHVNPASVNTN